jgi:drug/metabolite transporter (DMT)-like permease
VRLRVLSVALVVCNALGNYCLSVGMRDRPPADYVAAFMNPWVIAGIVLLIGWLLSQLSLLSLADLTYVLPISAAAYVGSAVLGAFALHERVSATRWAGVGLIALGILIVGRTRPRTGPTR